MQLLEALKYGAVAWISADALIGCVRFIKWMVDKRRSKQGQALQGKSGSARNQKKTGSSRKVPGIAQTDDSGKDALQDETLREVRERFLGDFNWRIDVGDLHFLHQIMLEVRPVLYC